MEKSLSTSIAALGALPSSKPIIAAEVGAAPYNDCAKCKHDWILNGYPAIYNKWWRLVAVVYFDVDMRFDNQPNWRLNAPTNAISAYGKIVNNSRFWVLRIASNTALGLSSAATTVTGTADQGQLELTGSITSAEVITLRPTAASHPILRRILQTSPAATRSQGTSASMPAAAATKSIATRAR